MKKLIDKLKNAGVKQGDLIVVALLLVISLALLLFSGTGGEGGWVRICVDGEQAALLSLDRDTVYEIPGDMHNVVEISGGKVRMVGADCPDGSCVRQGYASRTGECIVCLPARVTVTIVGESGSEELDAVAY